MLILIDIRYLLYNFSYSEQILYFYKNLLIYLMFLLFYFKMPVFYFIDVGFFDVETKRVSLPFSFLCSQLVERIGVPLATSWIVFDLSILVII